jgi:RNase P subunit RPR2
MPRKFCSKCGRILIPPDDGASVRIAQSGRVEDLVACADCVALVRAVLASGPASLGPPIAGLAAVEDHAPTGRR